MRSAPEVASLVEHASAYYRAAGPFAWHFARGKLGGDPVFAALLAQGLLQGRERLLDLGCGQGLLATWLLAARSCRAEGRSWPPQWPEPPLLRGYRGIEINPTEASRARQALVATPQLVCEIVHGDIRTVDYGTADAVVILDVLHYIDHNAQQAVIERVRAALPVRGLLLLRVGDAAAGLRSAFSSALDGAIALVRRGRWPRLSYRALDDWCALLERAGFSTRTQPMSSGTPFANVLFVAHAR
jgi:cyclopropane fatty-acyl-phospholipid synthase-like methyltransferase